MSTVEVVPNVVRQTVAILAALSAGASVVHWTVTFAIQVIAAQLDRCRPSALIAHVPLCSVQVPSSRILSNLLILSILLTLASQSFQLQHPLMVVHLTPEDAVMEACQMDVLESVLQYHV